MFYFKCINGIINLHDEVLPSILNKEEQRDQLAPIVLSLSHQSVGLRHWRNPSCPNVREYGTFCRKSCIEEHKQTLQVSKSALNHCDKENARAWKSICLLVTGPVICLFQIHVINFNVFPWFDFAQLHYGLTFHSGEFSAGADVIRTRI